jgi:hypothetical protein
MDVVRSTELPADSELLATLKPVATPSPKPVGLTPPPGPAEDAAPKSVRVALFTDIAVGDAP